MFSRLYYRVYIIYVHIGPSVLDVFQTLIKQLKKSVEDSKQVCTV